LLLISWWIVFNPTPFLEGAKGKKKMIHGSSSSSWCCYLLVPSRWNFLPYPKNKRNRSNFIIYSGGSTKYQLLFIFADSGPTTGNLKKKKKKRSVELRQSFLCTVWAFAEADDREKDSLKVGRIVLSTSAESTVVVHSSSLSYIAAAARRVVRRWCSSIYRTAR
jgi:hypothetical protein